jgi:hypothetical protein
VVCWPQTAHGTSIISLAVSQGLVWFPCCQRIGQDQSMDRWITSRKWSNAFDRLGIAIYIGWPILDVVVVLLENKTENEAASNGIWIMCVWATISDTTRNWPAYKQLHISYYLFNEPHHGHLGIDHQQVRSIKIAIYKQLHIAHYLINEPHHEHKLFILQYSIHPPAALLYFLRTRESQLRSPCLVNQKSRI